MEDGGRTAERNGTDVTHKESPTHGAPSNNEEGASRDFSIDVSMLHSGEPHTNNSRDHIMSGFPSLEQDHFPVILRPENVIAVELRTSSPLGNVGETQNTAPKNRKFTGAGISGNPTLDMPQNAAGLKLARKYYLITWVIFLVVFSLCVGLEIGLIYMCNLRSAEITYARMVPLMNHMGVVLAKLQSGSGRSSDLLRDLMATRCRLIEEFDRTQPYDNQIFWVNCYISSVLFGVLCVVAALCVKFRHHQSVKSRGRFFLVQYFVGASGALIFSVLTLANITHNLLDSNPLNPREYKSMEDLAIRQEHWANISIGLTAGAGFFVSILCSAYLQRQRLIHELFVGTLRVRGVPTTWEYFKMAPLAIFTTLLVVSGAIVAKYFYYSPERGYNFNGIHAQYAGFWAYPVIYVSGILYYSRNMGFAELRFSDFYCNLRSFVGISIMAVIMLVLTHTKPGGIYAFFTTGTMVRLVVTPYLTDSIAISLVYARIFHPLTREPIVRELAVTRTNGTVDQQPSSRSKSMSYVSFAGREGMALRVS